MKNDEENCISEQTAERQEALLGQASCHGDDRRDIDALIGSTSYFYRPDYSLVQACQNLARNASHPTRFYVSRCTKGFGYYKDVNATKLMAKALSRNKTIEFLTLNFLAQSNTANTQLLALSLQNHPTLTNVTISTEGHSIAVEALSLIFYSLATVENLKFLSLSAFHFNPAFFSLLGSTTPSLKRLEIDVTSKGSHQAKQHMPVADLKVFSRAMTLNNSIGVLGIHGDSPWPESLRNLFSAVFLDSAVHTLTISGFQVYDNKELIKPLKDLLERKTHVRSISFSKSEFHGSSFTDLSPALFESNSINELNLSSCIIGLKGTAILSELLASSKCKLKILTYQSAEPKAALAIFGCLDKNISLATLDVRGTCLGQDSLASLSLALKKNSTLQTLLLFTQPTLMELGTFAEALAENSTITKVWNQRATHPYRPGRTTPTERTDLIEFISECVRCNSIEDFDVKARCVETFRRGRPVSKDAELTSTPPAISTTEEICTPRTTAKCSQCHTHDAGDQIGLYCGAISDGDHHQHYVCVNCLEKHLSEHLDQEELACPIPGCSSQAWSVSNDLYGIVSVFHFKMHCKEIYQNKWMEQVSNTLETLKKTTADKNA